MTPQGNFLVIAPVLPGREDASRQLLGSMNAHPGVVDAQNTLVPFGQFDRLHFARLLILTDPTARDIAAYGVTVPDLPPTLVFFGDCDGRAMRSCAKSPIVHTGLAWVSATRLARNLTMAEAISTPRTGGRDGERHECCGGASRGCADARIARSS
jgi:hypothetical protein